MFNLDANAARSADNKSAFIDEAGKYIGDFTRAEYMEKQETGSTGIGFTYKTRDGAEGNLYVNLTYQHGTRNDGGYAIVNAIMACLKLRAVGAPQPIKFEKWNSDTKQREEVTAPGFPELMGKPIGLLLQMEIEKTSTTGMERPIIYAPFSAESEKTASEILDPKCMAPVKLAKMVQQLMKKPVRDNRPKHLQGQPSNDGYGHTQDEPHYEFDNIPFD